MWRFVMRLALLVVAAVVTLTLNAPMGPAAQAEGLDHLIGKRVPGAPTSWSAIRPFGLQCKKGTPLSCPPSLLQALATSDGGANFGSVDFYEFTSVSAAKDYYRQPAGNFAVNLAFMRPLAGPRPAGANSRWIDLEQCLYFSGPNPNDVPVDAPASIMTSSGKCPIGTAVPAGLGAMARRGNDIVVVNNPSGVDGLATTIPPSVRQVPVALALQVANLLRSGIREPQSIHQHG
jgi:hypothetical protein